MLIPEPTPLRDIRRLLAAALVIGMLGTITELLLIGHYDRATQLAPLVLLGLGLLSAAWHLASPTELALRSLQVLMVLFIASGLIGIGLHFTGNQEFELEMYPTRGGWDLVSKALTGATPVLAPGSMILLGLVGLAHTHRHPASRRLVGPHQQSSEEE